MGTDLASSTMRFVALGALLAAFLGLGLAAPVGDGPAPRTPSYSPGSAEPFGDGTLPYPSEDPIPVVEGTLITDELDRPTSVVATSDGRLLVTEKPGFVRVIRDGRVADDPLLDLDEFVPDIKTEQGLLSIALHPDFESNGRFFVNLTDGEGDVRVIEYRMSETEEDVADPRTARLIMRVDQPGQYHNGGFLQFGPDGFLYLSFGDGHFGVSQANAQIRENVLGSILRIDVDSTAPYSVPTDNPYVNTGFAPEIWVFGMRNPWRFWIDGEAGVLVIGDVGQFTWEEVTVVPLDLPGLNLGWPEMEGQHCYATPDCGRTGRVAPDLEYDHSLGCAVIGGPVYRGNLIPELSGMVVYSDFCSGFVKAFGLQGEHVVRTEELIATATYGPVQSLGVDAGGEILILTQSGEMRRLEPTG